MANVLLQLILGASLLGLCYGNLAGPDLFAFLDEKCDENGSKMVMAFEMHTNHDNPNLQVTVKDQPNCDATSHPNNTYFEYEFVANTTGNEPCVFVEEVLEGQASRKMNVEIDFRIETQVEIPGGIIVPNIDLESNYVFSCIMDLREMIQPSDLAIQSPNPQSDGGVTQVEVGTDVDFKIAFDSVETRWEGLVVQNCTLDFNDISSTILENGCPVPVNIDEMGSRELLTAATRTTSNSKSAELKFTTPNLPPGTTLLITCRVQMCTDIDSCEYNTASDCQGGTRSVGFARYARAISPLARAVPTGEVYSISKSLTVQEPTVTTQTDPTGDTTPTSTDATQPTSTDAIHPTSTDATQPTSPDAIQPTSTDAIQPTSPDAIQPTSTDAIQPTSTDAIQPTSLTGVTDATQSTPPIITGATIPLPSLTFYEDSTQITSVLEGSLVTMKASLAADQRADYTTLKYIDCYASNNDKYSSIEDQDLYSDLILQNECPNTNIFSEYDVSSPTLLEDSSQMKFRAFRYRHSSMENMVYFKCKVQLCQIYDDCRYSASCSSKNGDLPVSSHRGLMSQDLEVTAKLLVYDATVSYSSCEGENCVSLAQPLFITMVALLGGFLLITTILLLVMCAKQRKTKRKLKNEQRPKIEGYNSNVNMSLPRIYN